MRVMEWFTRLTKLVGGWWSVEEVVADGLWYESRSSKAFVRTYLSRSIYGSCQYMAIL